MRKQLLLCSSFLTLCLFVQAQWQLNGNSDATNSSKLGTTNNVNLRLFANNIERMRINSGTGKVGINSSNPIGRLHVTSIGTEPSGNWVTSGNPIFTGFGQGAVGNGDFILGNASNTANARGVLLLRRSRNTLANPTAVQNNDFLGSLLASGYDGTSFQNPATIDFYADGVPSAGNVPGRISMVTGSNSGNRKERLVVKSNGNVGIGTSAPVYALDVVGHGRFANGLSVEQGIFVSTGQTSQTALRAEAPSTAIIGRSGGELNELGYEVGGVGVEAISFGMNGTAVNATALGEESTGINASGRAFGIVATAADDGSTGVLGNGIAIGVSGVGRFIGVIGNSSEPGGDGVWGHSLYSNGVYGSTGTSEAYAGYFEGDVFSTGIYHGSDLKLKKNITELSSAMNMIKKLQPKTYEYRQEESFKLMNLPKGKRYGLIAQEVEQVLPGLVKNTNFEPPIAKIEKKEPGKELELGKETAPAVEKFKFKAVNYTELIPIMVKGMQEQDEKIESQSKRIEQLEELVNKLVNGGDAVVGLSNASLSSANPNPVNGSTLIGYNVPVGSKIAHLLVTDMKGSVVKQVLLNSRGSSRITLNTGALAAGTYTYSLHVDGRKVDSKQLLIAR